jgi:DHA2 family multidrug resistance protein
MIPIVFTSSLHYFQGPRRVYSAAVVGTIASVAPTLGPVIGGWITDTLNWHWLFYVNLAPGIAITLLVPFLVDIDKPDLRVLKDADYPGIALMAIALGTLCWKKERAGTGSTTARSALALTLPRSAEFYLSGAA